MKADRRPGQARARRLSASLLAIAVALVGCTSPPAETAADALLLQEEHTSLRDLQTRRFATADETLMLRASAAVLQDLGFILDDSESEVGLIVASKERTAVDPAEMTRSILLTLMMCTSPAMVLATGGEPTVAFDLRQQLRACLVIRTVANGVVVRVTFQRFVWNNEGKLSKLEALHEAEQYAEFFDRLAKAAFLQAHDL